VSAPIFHFDLGSPYAYLAAERVERAGDLGVRGVPSLVVGRTVFFGDDRLDEAVAAAGKPIA